MEPETRQSDSATRLRLVDLRIGADRGFHLGGRFAGVLTGPDDRAEAARWIASTLAGPRPAGSDATIDFAGQTVSVHSLPSPMLPPGAAILIDGDVVRAQWQASCSRRRDELAAVHASCRLEGFRIEAALERARTRVPAAGPAPVAAPVPRPEPEPVAPPPPVAPQPPPVDHYAPLRAHVQSLLTELDGSQSPPLPEGVLLADAWDAHSALVRVRKAVDALPATDMEALEQRVNSARLIAEGPAAGRVPEEVRTLIEQCHRAVVEAEAAAFEARRRERNRAIARYEEAVAAELMALADAGIDSYASFLVMTGSGRSEVGVAERIAAQAELAAAREALDAALQVPDVPTRAELEARETHMRVRATELLGHPPGPDPAAELRALRMPGGADVPAKMAEIAAVLRSAGLEVSDVIASARAFVIPPPPPPPPRPDPVAPVMAQVTVPSYAPTAPPHASDVASLERQRAEQIRTLQELEAELARLDPSSGPDVSRLPAADLALALEGMLAAYRGGYLLAGQLPLVIDGVLDGLAANAREAAVQVLAQATDVQSIVVSDDPEVMQSVANAGGTLVRWPAAAATPPAPGA